MVDEQHSGTFQEQQNPFVEWNSLVVGATPDHPTQPSSFQMEISDNNLSREILCCSTDGKISSQLEGRPHNSIEHSGSYLDRWRTTPSYNTNC